MPDRSCIAIVGATGAVGREALTILAARGVASRRVRAFASSRSAGAAIPYGDVVIRAEPFTVERAARSRCAVLCVDAAFARKHAAALVDRGVTAIDNSSAYRAIRDVPLVIPEINGEALRAGDAPRLVANPNCSTILLLVALDSLRRRFGINDLTVCTYQAVSGAGRAAMEELLDQTRAILNGDEPQPRVFPEPCAFNLFPHESPLDAATGLNSEERKIIEETRRLWAAPDLPIAPTCVRVPVWRAHSLAVEATLRCSATRDQLRAALGAAPGVRLLDDGHAAPPTPRRASDEDAVLVGRLRPRPGSMDGRGGSRRWRLWVCGDQLRKGAALNALQTADLLHPELGLGLFSRRLAGSRLAVPAERQDDGGLTHQETPP